MLDDAVFEPIAVVLLGQGCVCHLCHLTPAEGPGRPPRTTRQCAGLAYVAGALPVTMGNK